jgi:hypothetical protein
VPAADPNTIGSRLHANGWQTGSVLRLDHTTSVAPLLQRAGHSPYPLRDDDWLIVVSQTCDIVALRLAAEPYVEILIAEQRKAIDSTKANLRSTRFLSFRAQPGGTVLEAHATHRFWLPREQFDDWVPDKARTVDPVAVTRLCEWLGLRYTRPAWPEQLVHRLNPKKDRIEQILRTVASQVAEIRVTITDVDRELPPDIPYRLTIYAVVDAATYDGSQPTREACAAALFDFIDALRGCQGIEIDENSDLVSGAEFTWEMTRLTHLWNFANLTATAQEG